MGPPSRENAANPDPSQCPEASLEAACWPFLDYLLKCLPRELGESLGFQPPWSVLPPPISRPLSPRVLCAASCSQKAALSCSYRVGHSLLGDSTRNSCFPRLCPGLCPVWESFSLMEVSVIDPLPGVLAGTLRAMRVLKRYHGA